MKNYNALTAGGKKKRLAKLVARGLESYDVQVQSIKYLDTHTNMFFKITDDNQKTYAAKVVMDPFIAVEDNLQEIDLLACLAKHPDIKVPKVIQNKDGESVITVESQYTPQAHRMILYEWFEGKDLDGHENEQTFRAVGSVTAQIHAAFKDLKSLRAKVKRWDQVFYFNGEEALYRQKQYAHLVSDQILEILDIAVAYLNRELPKLYHKGEVSVMHGDLHQWNIKTQREDLVVFDFEDNLLGVPLHEMAITLFYYRYDKRFDFDQVIQWYLEGYESVQTFAHYSRADLEMLMIARRVNFMNYILLINENPRTYLETNMERVRAYLISVDAL